MNGKTVALIGLAAGICLPGRLGLAEPGGEDGAAGESAPPAEARDAGEPEFWFPVGEELIYDIYWGRVHVGHSRVWTEWVEQDGRRLLAIRMRTRSNRVLSTIYPVDDFIESLVDPETFLPVRFTKQLSEGRHRADEVTDFDHAAGTAHWRSRLRNRENTFEIQENTRDIPTLMYSLRGEEFLPHQTRQFEVMADEKLYELQTISFDVEPVRLSRYGVIPSLKIEPVASFGGVFVRKGRMWLWLSQDPRAVLTRISVEVPVARVHLYLREIRGPGAADWPPGAGGGAERR